jgi:ABC-type transport system involved in cytochrome c biogenesis permease subunit
MANAFASGNQVDFDNAANPLEKSILSRAPPSRSLAHLDLELAVNRLDPFYKAELFYGFAFIVGMIAIAANRRWLRLATLALVLLALAPHAGGIIARMIIMGRPPVTNLFATFLFVGFVCVLLGLIVEAFQKNGLGILLSSVAGLVLLLVSGRFGDGDTMGVMIAVLDSNFWLSTHVVCVTIGYAGCFFAGLFGAVYLIAALWLPPDNPRRNAIARVTYGVLAFGIIFAFLGTMLGGVWADQSWGRFWGWDPKENGALLIVIWSTLLFHARISKIIHDIGFAAGAALGIIVVLMAWLGINLLGVGLHNYGFTNQMALGFWTGVGTVAAFVVVILPFVKRKPSIRNAN